jgi:mRNA interferase MazF
MKRGDVVVVDWPFSDRQGSKLRPALVVQADFLNGRIDDSILVLITRRVRSASGTESVIDPAQETASGLSHVSVASCTNLLTVDQALIHRTIGYLTDAAMRQVNDCLKTALELP